LGNPIIWWSNLVFLLLFLIIFFIMAVKHKRGVANGDAESESELVFHAFSFHVSSNNYFILFFAQPFLFVRRNEMEIIKSWCLAFCRLVVALFTVLVHGPCPVLPSLLSGADFQFNVNR
jgi:hypothetical protein